MFGSFLTVRTVSYHKIDPIESTPRHSSTGFCLQINSQNFDDSKNKLQPPDHTERIQKKTVKTKYFCRNPHKSDWTSYDDERWVQQRMYPCTMLQNIKTKTNRRDKLKTHRGKGTYFQNSTERKQKPKEKGTKKKLKVCVYTFFASKE